MLSISVDIPIFNSEKYLIISIDSILAYMYSDFEFIFSENDSTDRKQEICNDYASKDRRLRLYRNDTKHLVD
jgi:glycosyltransferase involved in cell wall biosynthesis